MTAIQHRPAMRDTIDNALKHLETLEAAGFQVIGYHVCGPQPTFTVMPIAEVKQLLDYVEAHDEDQ